VRTLLPFTWSGVTCMRLERRKFVRFELSNAADGQEATASVVVCDADGIHVLTATGLQCWRPAPNKCRRRQRRHPSISIGWIGRK
jgi:hypothetical protein